MLKLKTESGKEMSFETFEDLMSELKSKNFKTDKITELYADEGSVKETEIRSLYKILEKHDDIKFLDLSDNGFGKIGAEFVGKIIKRLEKLERVDISHNAFGKNVDEVIKYAEKHDALQIINLANNAIGNKGADKVADVIKRLDSLEELYLMNNDISRAGMKDLFDAVEDSKTLKIFDVSNNDCDHASKYIRSMLENNAVLEKLYLDDAKLDVKDIERIMEGMEKNFHLTLLSLDGQSMSDETYAKLDAMVDGTHKNLKVVAEEQTVMNMNLEDSEDDDAIEVFGNILSQALSGEIADAEVEIVASDAIESKD